jgi:hypothetical protein
MTGLEAILLVSASTVVTLLGAYFVPVCMSWLDGRSRGLTRGQIEGPGAAGAGPLG